MLKQVYLKLRVHPDQEGEVVGIMTTRDCIFITISLFANFLKKFINKFKVDSSTWI